MIALLFPLLALTAGTALAQESMVSRNDAGDSVRIERGACADAAILAHVPREYHARLQRGEAVLGGKRHALCWGAAQDGWVVLVYADGDTGRVPVAAFAPESNL